MLKKPSCAECRFWQPSCDTDDTGEYEGIGQCRRRTPHGARDLLNGSTASGWPETWWDEWCGEWEAKAITSKTIGG